MPDAATRGDSIRTYHTGAASHAGTQASADASLGNYLSANEVSVLGAVITSPISNVTVDFVSGENGTGAGTLTAASSSTLTWTPPGGTAGAAVTISNGETKILEGGGSDGPKKFIRVTRTSASSLTGTATVTLSDVVNNVVGFDNVSSGEASAGDNEYRCIGIKNVSSATVAGIVAYVGTLGTSRVSDVGQLGSSGSGTITTSGSLADWPESGWVHIRSSTNVTREICYYSSRTSTALTIPSGGRGLLGTSAAAGSGTDLIDAVPPIRIAKEAPASQPSGAVQTVANESSAPSGVTWNTGINAAMGVSIGSLTAGQWQGLWIHRAIPAGAVAAPVVLHKVPMTFDAA